MASLTFTAGDGSYEEFVAAYESGEKPDTAAAGKLLLEAVGNDDVAARVAIATRLLDDGADATCTSSSGANALHIMLGRRTQDFAAEAPLLARLIAGGADINKVIARFGTPLETVTLDSAFSEAELAPVYDVFFAQQDLDLRQDRDDQPAGLLRGPHRPGGSRRGLPGRARPVRELTRGECHELSRFHPQGGRLPGHEERHDRRRARALDAGRSSGALSMTRDELARARELGGASGSAHG